MYRIVHSVARRSRELLGLIALVGAAVMLIMLPVPRFHLPTDHFRAPQISQSVEQHFFVDQTKSDVSERISSSYIQPTRFFSVVLEDQVQPQLELTQVPPVPLTRLLLRLKLKSSHSHNPDPLI